MVPYRTKWRRQQIAVYWFDLQMAHDEGLVFWQTISTAIVLNDSMPADCLLKMVKRNHEILYHKTKPESQVTPDVVVRATWRQDQLSSEKPEACCSSSDHLSPGKLGATLVRDRETRLLSAHAVPMKGAVMEWTAQQVVRDLERLGHHERLVIRCDGEAALKSHVSEVARMRGDVVTISEHSAVGDSQGNGLIERAVRTVKGTVRTLKLDLEARVSETLKITHKVILWLTEHAIDLVNRVQVGQDGKTSFERV